LVMGLSLIIASGRGEWARQGGKTKLTNGFVQRPAASPVSANRICGMAGEATKMTSLGNVGATLELMRYPKYASWRAILV